MACCGVPIPASTVSDRCPTTRCGTAAGLTDSFARVPRTPPLSALGFVALSPTFGWRDLAAMNARAALPLLDVRVPEVYERFDGMSATAFLERVRFPEAAHHLAFEVFSRSFFADPRELSAAELLLMFHIYFLGSSEGLLFDVPNEPFPQALWEPLGDYLRSLGTEVRTGTPVHGVHPCDAGGVEVRTDSVADRYDAAVLALDPGALREVVAASPGLGTPAWRDDIAALVTAPAFLVSRLWLDRPVRADRPGFLGTSGYDGLDNVSVLDRYEGEAARWAARTGGSVVELHAYAVAGRHRTGCDAEPPGRESAPGLPGDTERTRSWTPGTSGAPTVRSSRSAVIPDGPPW